MRIASELEITVTDRCPWQQQTQGSDDANQTGRRMKIQLEFRDYNGGEKDRTGGAAPPRHVNALMKEASHHSPALSGQ